MLFTVDENDTVKPYLYRNCNIVLKISLKPHMENNTGPKGMSLIFDFLISHFLTTRLLDLVYPIFKVLISLLCSIQ